MPKRTLTAAEQAAKDERHRAAIERDRRGSVSPLTPEEYAGAEALGGYIRELRFAGGLSVPRAARASDMSENGWWRIENATRRTRHSTVERIAKGLGAVLGIDPNEVYAELVKRADNALAPESEYRERVERRRAERIRRKVAQEDRLDAQAENWRQVKADIEDFERHLSDLAGAHNASVGGRIRF